MMRSVRYLRLALLLMVASALSAASAQEEGFTITGTISNWPGGEGEVKAEHYNPMAPQMVRAEVATATIAEDGSFEITLPPTHWLRSQLRQVLERCEDVTITPELTSFGFVDLIIYRNGEAIADLYQEQFEEGVWFPQVGNRSSHLQYYSNDATIQANCERVDVIRVGDIVIEVVDTKVEQGWNAVVWTVTETRWPEEFYVTEVVSVGGGEDVPWVAQFKGRIGLNLEPNEDNSAVVVDVLPGFPAQLAGLLLGDVIVKVNGQDFRGKNPLPLIRGEPGTTVTLGVMREGEPEPMEFEITRRNF